jgi:hypothetical protein
MLLDAIYSTSKAWFSMNPLTVVWSWRKLHPDLEDNDLQGFYNKEISMSKISDIMCATRSF